jgi:uncharacterized coiled-coil DUF342 family protein
MDSESTQTPVEHLYHELEELKRKTADEKAAINDSRHQIDETVKQRDALNTEVKGISEDVKKLRAQRDALNAKVKGLKQKRDELQAAAARKREVLSKLLEQARQISEELHGSMSELSKQIKGLEWYIQTNPLAPKTERNVVAKIGALEANLVKHKGLRNVRDKLLQLKIEVGALRLQAQATHDELTKIAKESEKAHSAMQELVKALKEKKEAADAKHSEYLERSKQRHDLALALREHLQRIQEIRSQIGEAKTSSKIEKVEKIKSKYKEAANAKLRAGGKLSFEEFQALMADTLPESEDEQ